MSTLLAKPWIGEFGHELFGWQGHLRTIAGNYDKVCVSSRSGNEYLYSDFCTEFIPFDPKGTETSTHFLKDINREDSDFVENIYKGRVGDVMEARTQYNNGSPKFVKLGRTDKRYAYDIVVHPRSTDKWDTGYRNWPLDKWNEFIERFSDYRIALVGTCSQSLSLKGVTDHRDKSLTTLGRIMASSKSCVGPSSGPIHFASLCGCPHVVWSGNEGGQMIRNRDRYERHWNPFITPVTMIDNEGWQPSVETVARALRRYI